MLTFLKLGGSLITNKGVPETARIEVIERLADEIAGSLRDQPDLRLLIGHGSGSFGHSAASKYRTHEGVHSPGEWRGFAHVSVVAARLNMLVIDALDRAGVAVFRVQPSASAQCTDGVLSKMDIHAIERALAGGLVPVVHGDVAFDNQRGGTIISTEQVFEYLAPLLQPSCILLAGEVAGVLDEYGNVIRLIDDIFISRSDAVVGASEHVDVTGGMQSKVTSVLNMCATVPHLRVRIFSGIPVGNVRLLLSDPGSELGTEISPAASRL